MSSETVRVPIAGLVLKIQVQATEAGDRYIEIQARDGDSNRPLGSTELLLERHDVLTEEPLEGPAISRVGKVEPETCAWCRPLPPGVPADLRSSASRI